MANLMKKLTIGGTAYEVCDANARTTLTDKASYADMNAAVSKAAPRNLLDNSDFRNPINQRGKTTYDEAATVYTIDRWRKAASLTMEVMDSYVRLTCTSTTSSNGISQLFEHPPAVGTKVTLALKEKNGEIYVGTSNVPESGYNNAFKTADGIFGQIRPDRATIMVPVGLSIDIEWVVVYEGEYTTETLPEYQYKGYVAEFNECLRYYFRGPFVGDGYVYSSSMAYIIQQLPVKMRVVPTITIPEGGAITARDAAGTKVQITEVGDVYRNGFSVRFQTPISNMGLLVNSPLSCITADLVEFSADL